MKIASFDIFDTTLIRICGECRNIFYLLAMRLYPDDIKKQTMFFYWRSDAEKAAIERYKRNVSIEEIYTLYDNAAFPEYSSGEVQEMELDMEEKNLIVNPLIVERIAQYRKDGYFIMFISDMYLHSAFLRTVLEKRHCISGNEPVFVSCEHHARKSDGKLYRIISDKYKPEEWIHYGDNVKSDYVEARKQRIDARLTDTSFTDLERGVLKTFPKDRNYHILSTLVGIQRASRTTLENLAPGIFASEYIACSYISYVLHILEEAKRRNIKKLYFLFRDSYLFYKIAQWLTKDEKNIELHYLFVSRKSLLKPSLENFTQQELYESFGITGFYKTGKPFRYFLEKLGIDIEDFKLHYGYSIEHASYTKKEDERFCDCLLNHYETFRKISEAEHVALVKYLTQEGFLSKEPTAIVDLGWYGTTRLLLNRILKRYGFPQVYTFYWMTFKRTLSARYGEYEAFLSDERYVNLAHLVEKYFSMSPYHSVEKYVVIGDVSVPVFQSQRDLYDQNIISSNLKATYLHLKYIETLGIKPYLTSFIASLWYNGFLSNLLSFKSDIGFSRLLALRDSEYVECNIDRFIKHFDLRDLIRYINGNSVTLWDSASLYVTYGRLGKCLITYIRNFVAKFIRYKSFFFRLITE